MDKKVNLKLNNVILWSILAIIPNVFMYLIHRIELNAYFSHIDIPPIFLAALILYCMSVITSSIIAGINHEIRKTKYLWLLGIALYVNLLGWIYFYFTFDPGPCCVGG